MDNLNEGFVNIALPSKGLVYQGVDLKSLMIRSLRGRDEKMIAEMIPDNFEKRFIGVFRNVLKGIDPTELTLGDRLFVLVWLAINSYSPVHPFNLMCETCLQKISIDVNLSNLNVVELPDDFKEPYVVTLSTGKIVNMRLLRVKDEISAIEFEKSGNSWLYKIALTMTDYKNVGEALRYLEDLPASDVALLRYFHDKFYHGPDMHIDYICPKCAGGGRVAIPFRIDYILPSGAALVRAFDKKF